ncbi:MAG: HupE/UreJ family protein [Rhodobacter sp.]|nr:HupE/UreJ family protein [Rhodobacter sp.]MCA3513319.1 HupE/UreJ family protein [Rhodobacter sp.]MCA3524069.1 HupE/UreJ family protein [Rhodobacter sp.]MCA3527188.1 HupE/UreJ family protein [Rhodobacter sp.]MCA3529574.1 HupE/UreJ family protein [Rhodobacter sp.]
MMRWLVLAVFAIFGLAQPPAAHESRPAFLDIREITAGRYEVVWKRPMRGDYVIGFTVGWPEGCTPTVTNESQVPGASVTRMMLDCGAKGLAGGTIMIGRLPETSAEVLVRVGFADGTSQTRLLRPASAVMTVEGPQGAPAVGAEYLRLGFDHILAGIDHLAFVLGLTLIVGGGWKLVKTITAFTVAHSITLALSTLGHVRVSQAPVEAAIALSIVFLAREILLIRQGRAGLTSRAPWLVAFVFGLLHGLGFAGALREIGLPQGDIPLALLAFNLGVEAGQLAFVAVVLSVVALGRRLFSRPLPEWIGQVPAYGIGTVAAFWTLERILAA